MTAFWEQDWFQDAAPYMAAGLAVTGALAGGASQGWFGEGAQNWTANNLGIGETVGEAAAPSFTSATGDTEIYGPVLDNAASTAPAAVPAAAQSAGNIQSALPKEVTKAGQTSTMNDIWNFVKRNPALLSGAVMAGGALMNAGSKRPQAPSTQQQIDAQRTADAARWNAIPVRRLPARQAQALPVGFAPGLAPEARYFNQGGALGYRDGGRLSGPGDGMSDDIPAVAHQQDGGQRPVSVADGEYIIPADVVSGLGNGSSDAGIRHLDALLRRVRQARGGDGEQPPALDAGRLLKF